MKKTILLALLAGAAFAADITLYETWVPSGLTTNWVPVSRWATTQEVAVAVAPLASTQHVAEAINAIPPAATNYVLAAEKELHWDSYTNVVWRSTFSNGWHWLHAYTNQPWSSQ